MSGLIKMGSYYVPINSVNYFLCDDDAKRCTAHLKRYYAGIMYNRDVSTKTLAEYHETKLQLDTTYIKNM